MSDTYKRFNGSSWVDIAQVKHNNGSAYIDCQFVRKNNGSAWVDVWTPNIEIKDNDYTSLDGWYKTLLVSNKNGLGYSTGYAIQQDNGIQIHVVAAANNPTPPVTTYDGCIFNKAIDIGKYNTFEMDFTVIGVEFNEKRSYHGSPYIRFYNPFNKPPQTNTNIIDSFLVLGTLSPLHDIVGIYHSDSHGCNIVNLRSKSISHFNLSGQACIGIFANGSWGKVSGASGITFIVHGFKLYKEK